MHLEQVSLVRLTLRVSRIVAAHPTNFAGTVVACELARHLLGPRRHRSTTSATRNQPVGESALSTRPDGLGLVGFGVPSGGACLLIHIVPVGSKQFRMPQSFHHVCGVWIRGTRQQTPTDQTLHLPSKNPKTQNWGLVIGCHC